jgi:hypothetical protein
MSSQQEGVASEPESTITQKTSNGMPGHLQNAARPTTIENNAVVKNLSNTNSLRQAVNAMCFYCMGCTADRYEPGTRDEIRRCTATSCPLYRFRPYSTV